MMKLPEKTVNLHPLEKRDGYFRATEKVLFSDIRFTAGRNWNHLILPPRSAEEVACCRAFAETLLNVDRANMLEACYAFSWRMSFKGGHHRDHRSGGSIHRDSAHIFGDTFQGKLAEILVWQALYRNRIAASFPDLRVFGEGVWDSGDILLPDGRIVAVKSSTGRANLLLLETKDYKNTLLGPAPDLYVFVRINPDIHGVVDDFIKTHKIQRNPDELLIPLADRLLLQTSFSYDIAGVVDAHTVDTALELGHILYKGDRLGLKGCVMDAENIYVQSGDMIPFDAFCRDLSARYTF